MLPAFTRAASRSKKNTVRYELACAKSRNNNELWPSLVEKAFAKYYGGYQNLDGGFVHLGLVDLTGGVGEHVKIGNNSIINVGGGTAVVDLWNKLIHLHNHGDLIGAGSHAGNDNDFSPQGIVQGHAYAVLKLVEVDQYKLVKVRNPWGFCPVRNQWRGRFCDDDDSRWTERLKAVTMHDPTVESCIVSCCWIYKRHERERET
jgi:hypothetical protein